MFNSIEGIRKASFESDSTVRQWFCTGTLSFWNTTISDSVFPIGQRGAIFLTSEYMSDPDEAAWSLRYASRNEEGRFTITTLDGFMQYESESDAEEAAEAYQRFYREVMNIRD